MYLDTFHRTGHIVDSLGQEGISVVVNLSHVESLQIWCEGDLGPLFAFFVIGNLASAMLLMWSHLWSSLRTHVLAEDLFVFLAIDLVCSFDD